ncbi:CLUMA_CG016703, isoform A [Clunio marinus]|uniref:CLUMA_CG016703, isoform A n=1 Tax=Clunio marinus TaxID=568069 RepID=A0A1J1IWK7_9DIPT|nr:CLUMA_CG016703, isoform A [Clunio marinus]
MIREGKVLKLARTSVSNEACSTSEQFHMTDDIFPCLVQCFGCRKRIGNFSQNKSTELLTKIQNNFLIFILRPLPKTKVN